MDTKGDITGLYVNDLIRHWRKAPVAVAGLTPYAQLFALQLMAEGAGLRLVYLAHHGAGPERVFAPHEMRQRLAGAAGAAAPEVAAAYLLANWPRDQLTISAAHSNIAAAPDRGVAADTLVSWLLAPVRRPTFARGHA